MKTYLLKYPVYNSVDFPTGTVVKILDVGGKSNNGKFEVMEGELDGEKGEVADTPLTKWLVENTTENRRKLLNLIDKKRLLEEQIEELNNEWENTPTVIL